MRHTLASKIEAALRLLGAAGLALSQGQDRRKAFDPDRDFLLQAGKEGLHATVPPR